MFSSLLPKPQNVGTKELPQKAYIYKPDNKQMNFNLQKCWINSLENFRKMVQASSSEFSSLFVILCSSEVKQKMVAARICICFIL